MSLRDDTGWTRAKTAPERLLWVRTASDLTQDDMGLRLGEKRGNYRKYEAGTSPLTYEKAVPWSRRLKLQWRWMLHGEGTPWTEAPGDRARELVEALPAARQERVVQALEDMLTGTDG